MGERAERHVGAPEMRGFYELLIALHRASWPADRFGPMVISVPHRGHSQSCFSGILERASSFGRSAARQCRTIDSKLWIGKKPKVPDADEGTWQYVLSESLQEVGCGECHHALLVAMRIVFPPECNAVTIEGQQSMIADGNAMRVTA